MKWDRSCHRWPCPETDRIDRVLNDLEEFTRTLTPSQQGMIVRAADFRYARHRNPEGENHHKYGRRDGHHTPACERDSIAAEFVCADIIGVEWVDTHVPDKKGDLGSGLQVRHTWRSDGTLIIREDDADDHTFFLVTGKMPTFTVHGCMLAGDAKKHTEWYGTGLDPTRDKAWAVPQSELMPIRQWLEAYATP